MRLISSEDLFFREHHDFRTKFGFCPRISDNLLENQDSGKCHKIRAKLYCPPQFFELVRVCDWSQSRHNDKEVV